MRLVHLVAALGALSASVASDRVTEAASMTLKINLQAADPSALPRHLDEVSSIASKSYGHYLSRDDISSIVAPSEKAVAAVLANITAFKPNVTGPRIVVDLPVATVESLFQAQIQVVNLDGKAVLRPLNGVFTVPMTWQPHVMHIEGLDHIPPRLQALQSSSKRLRRRLDSSLLSNTMNLATIQRLYNLPNDLDSSFPSNGVVVGAFVDQNYLNDDIATNLAYNTMPKLTLFPQAFGCDGERSTATSENSLDIQLLVGLTRSNATSVYCYNSLRDPTRDPSDDNQERFLDFLRDVNAMEPAAGVVSISYADDEIAVPASYRAVLDREFMIAGLRGTTIVTASGDNGVVGARQLDIYGPPRCQRFQVLYPASSPYVVSVGATVVSNDITSSKINEVAIMSRQGAGVTTTGGFSDYAVRPSFQDEHVTAYLNLKGNTSSELFNIHGRAIPDVSFVGHNIPVHVNGRLTMVDGTSASSPIFAAIVSHMNRVRLSLGRPKLGFILPYLYELHRVCPHIFRDVTEGNNACGAPDQTCCQPGFDATEGWDPVGGILSMYGKTNLT
ncbi:polynucleotide 3'-phosphatase [Aphanomyces cochlioides]|nr:polynucleotide 3'-phosphatase [Aphanomyces cochlioides]